MKKYTLITVTHAGKVHVQESIQSRAIAEQAQSIALRGVGVGEKNHVEAALERHGFYESEGDEDEPGSCKFARIFEEEAP